MSYRTALVAIGFSMGANITLMFRALNFFGEEHAPWWTFFALALLMVGAASLVIALGPSPETGKQEEE